MDKIKIALIRSSPRASRVILGAESIILSIAERVNKNKFEMLIITFKEKGDSEPPLAARAKGAGLPVLQLELNGRFDTGSIARLRKILLDNGVDIMHSNEYKSDLIGFLATRKTPIKKVATAHGFLGTDPKISFYERIDIEVLKRFDKIVAVSGSMKSVLAGRGIPAEKIVEVENAVDTGRYGKTGCGSAIRRELGIPEPGLLVVGIGRLSPERGFDRLLEAMSKVIRERKGAYLAIAGDGALRAPLERKARDLGIADNTRFLGFRNDADEILSAADIFVSSSLKDSFGIAVIEAMAAGKPVVSTRTGIAPEAIEDMKTGMLVGIDDAAAIYNAVTALADDGELRKRMGSAAKDAVNRRFSLEAMVKRYERVYMDLEAGRDG
ncbi:MAG: glycosyltransferase family 4 protein [Candidatus Omnitrophota bacterium]